MSSPRRGPRTTPDLHQLDNTFVTGLDVTDIDSIDAAVEAALDRFGGIGSRSSDPGSIVTEFRVCSFDFHDDPDLVEFRTMMDTLNRAIAQCQESAQAVSPPSAVAEVVYRAATDGTDTIRSCAGDNAADFFSRRAGMTDEEYSTATRHPPPRHPPAVRHPAGRRAWPCGRLSAEAQRCGGGTAGGTSARGAEVRRPICLGQ